MKLSSDADIRLQFWIVELQQQARENDVHLNANNPSQMEIQDQNSVP